MPSTPPPPSPAAPTDRAASQAQVELVSLAFRELPPATYASAAAAIVFAVAAQTSSKGTVTWVWLACMLALSGVRLALARTFFRSSLKQADVERWTTYHTVATTATAAGWAVSVWLFPPLGTASPLGFLHALILVGLSVGAAQLLLPVRFGGAWYVAVLMLPLALRFITRGDATHLALGGSVLLFAVYIVYALRRNHRALAGAIQLRIEREMLTGELQTQAKLREAREAELRDARQQAEAASRAKGEFLANISHEIRTPMNGLLGMLRIVRDTPLSAQQRDYLKTATDSAETLLLLLNDVLDFSKIDAGRLELHPAAFAPAATARTVVDLLYTRARDKGLQLNLRIDDQVPSAVLGDAGRVRQILVALVTNGIKFTEQGHVDVTLTCAERTDDRVVLHLSVTDTGIGIDSASLDRLFQPFSQADSSLKRRYAGTGLGLAISMRLAKAMGGVLQVQSTLNRGSTFRLILPCALPEGVVPTTSPAATSTPPLLHGRVLVVEDDSVNRQVMELFLRKMHVTPVFAPDGEAAIRLATTEAFDLILMDCHLPGIDGLETTRRIREHSSGRDVRIIALTANATPAVRDGCFAAGMNDYLTKPVRLESLVTVLQRYLAKD